MTEPRPAGTLPQPGDLGALEQALAKPQSEARLREAYRAAHRFVELLVRRHGRDTVLNWIEAGPPDNPGSLLR
jgi:hypothetical protein